MRTAILLGLALLVSGCSSSDMCRTIPLGSGIAGFERTQLGADRGFLYNAMLVPAASAPFGRGTASIWDTGPAEAAMCCGSQQTGTTLAWCSGEQLTCAEPDLQDVQLYVLEAPYTDESGSPDWADYCFIAASKGRVIAVWHRYWS